MKLFVFGILLFVTGCCAPPTTCETPQHGHVVLIGYKRAKHSYLFFKLVEVNSYHKLSCGRRKGPTINLGDTLNVDYCINGDKVELLLDAYQYSANTTSTRRYSGQIW